MNKFRAIFFLAGIALIIVGANNSTPIMIVGIGLIVLAVVGGVLTRRKGQGDKESSD
jgi:hypothetical protein